MKSSEGSEVIVDMAAGRLVIDAAAKYGFNLEFKAKRIFEEKGYSTEINRLYQSEEEYLEIDLIASHQDRVFVAECKGTAKNSVLILIKEPESSSLENMFKRRAIYKLSTRIIGYGGKGMFCTFTGDFFNKDPKGLKKSSKNDSENNFYKAQQQITAAVCAVAQNNEGITATEGTPQHLIPLIITNGEIWVVNYEEEPVSAKNHKWIKHKIRSNSTLSLYNNSTVEPSYLANVVHINYLDEFLEKAKSMNRSNGTMDNLNNTLV